MFPFAATDPSVYVVGTATYSQVEGRIVDDNADERLTEIGYRRGLVDSARYEHFKQKQRRIVDALVFLETTIVTRGPEYDDAFAKRGIVNDGRGYRGIELLKRPEFHYKDLLSLMPGLDGFGLDDDEILSLETKVQFEGYIVKQKKEAENLVKQERILLPNDLDYLHLDGLRLEARQKLDAVRPISIGQASRIPGVNPADVSVLLLTLRKRNLL